MGAGREVSISLDGVRDKNVMQLKKLNTALFPVRYNDKYYADALASGDFTKLGLYTPLFLFFYMCVCVCVCVCLFCFFFLIFCLFFFFGFLLLILILWNGLLGFLCFGFSLMGLLFCSLFWIFLLTFLGVSGIFLSL
jgi:hypothetical protein